MIEVEDCIRADVLVAHALLHDVSAKIEAGETSGQTILTGHYRLTLLSAVGLLNYSCTDDDVGYPPQVVLDDGTIATIDLDRRRNRRDMIRVMRIEVLRYEGTPDSPSKESEPHEVRAFGRDNQRHRERCRAIAALLWHADPTLTIEAVIDRDEFARFGQENSSYDRKVLRGWINDLCPNRAPGRRPKTSAEKTPG